MECIEGWGKSHYFDNGLVTVHYTLYTLDTPGETHRPLNRSVHSEVGTNLTPLCTSCHKTKGWNMTLFTYLHP